jgi:asparagine synthase (glutamine-hydrolysing)
MCGITGFISDDGNGEKCGMLTRMTSTLMHRGPDAWGRYLADGVALGHTRLSIIDLKAGHQPMITENSAMVFNGEIYNYLELRRELAAEGIVFSTDSDTEVALKAIEHWGTDAFARFNGQFAILFWDKKRKELLAVRDHYGVRPLFYSITAGGVFFASEMKALDASSHVRRTWAPESLLVHGLFWNTLGDETVFNEVRSLPPGSWAVFSSNALVRRGFYYRLGETESEVPETYEEAKQVFRKKLEKSVSLRLRSDVPVGCYLSGGIDSSVTSYLARQIKGDRFKSFSVTFDDPSLDEGSYQNLMVKDLGTEHFSELITRDTIDACFLEVARHFERPVFRTAPVPLYVLSARVRREHIKVVLTGEGADEILCGYDVFKEIKLLEAWENGATGEEIQKVLGQLYPHLDHYSEEGNSGLMRMYYEGFLGKMKGPGAGLAIRLHNNRILEKYLNKDWKISLSDGEIEARLANDLPPYVLDWSALKRNQFLEMKTLLEGYLLSSQGDRMSMAHGVEGRYPFLDSGLVEWAFNIPHEWKMKDYQQKFILKDTFKDDLPPQILDRPKRPYMAPDLVSFIRDGVPTGNAAGFLNSATVEDYGIFDPKMVDRLLFKYRRRGTEGIGYRDNMLLSFILSAQMAEYWIRNPPSEILDERLCTVDIRE